MDFARAALMPARWGVALASTTALVVLTAPSTAQSRPAMWMADGSYPGGKFGWRVATAGDVNGDGFDDLLVAAPWASVDVVREGRVLLYAGGVEGPSDSPQWQAKGGSYFAAFGEALAGGFDVNGDGFDDVVVGAPDFTNTHSSQGRASLYLGSVDGLTIDPAWELEGRDFQDFLGTAVAGAGDVNGDGFDDVIIGAPGGGIGTSGGSGCAYLYLGSAGGLASAPAWTGSSGVAPAGFGVQVCGAGDLNGDGFDDVAVSAPYLAASSSFPFGGRAFVYLGSAAGLAVSPDWSFDGLWGRAHGVVAAGDVDADGFDDLIVRERFSGKSAPASGPNTYLFHGSNSGLAACPDWRGPGPFPAGNADVNADGFDDVILSTSGGPQPGRVGLSVYLGSPNGLSPSPNWTTLGSEAGDGFPGRPALADVNGDGFADLAAGAASLDRCSWTGRAYVFDGCSLGGCSFGARSYCEGWHTSVDFGAYMSFDGSLDVATNNFYLTAGCVPAQPGFFVYSATPARTPLGDGLLCISRAPSGLFRLGPPALPSSHLASRRVDFAAPPASSGPGQVLGGSTWYFQYWFRDPGGPGGSGFNLSDGLAVSFR